MTSNKKRQSGWPTCNSITFLLPFESNWSTVNTRLRSRSSALPFPRSRYIHTSSIYTYILSLSDFSFASCARCTGWKVLSELLATIARTDGFRGGGDERGDEVFSIRTALRWLASRRTRADKGSRNSWLVVPSFLSESRYRVTDPTNQSVSQCTTTQRSQHAVKARNPMRCV